LIVRLRNTSQPISQLHDIEYSKYNTYRLLQNTKSLIKVTQYYKFIYVLKENIVFSEGEEIAKSRGGPQLVHLSHGLSLKKVSPLQSSYIEIQKKEN
jgi:hypothetical protein